MRHWVTRCHVLTSALVARRHKSPDHEVTLFTESGAFTTSGNQRLWFILNNFSCYPVYLWTLDTPATFLSKSGPSSIILNKRVNA